MRYAPYFVLLGVFWAYVLLVLVFGFSEPMALAIHFARTTVIMAVLVIFAPAMLDMFNSKPYRSRDFLLGGIILTELSNESFSVWNEMFRIFGVDNSIFTSPVSGFFSLLLVLGGVSFLIASDVEGTRRWLIALVIAVIFGGGLAFVAPIFR